MPVSSAQTSNYVEYLHVIKPPSKYLNLCNLRTSVPLNGEKSNSDAMPSLAYMPSEAHPAGRPLMLVRF